jgi:vancomycin resistance protein VanJ
MSNAPSPQRSFIGFLRRVFTSTFVALSGAYGLSVSGFLLLRLLVGETTAVIGFVSTFLHLLMLPALVLFPLSLFFRKPRLALMQAAPVAVFLASYGTSFLPRSPSIEPNALVFSLLTYNIHDEDECLVPILDVIRAADADVVLVQEVGMGAAACFEENLSELYPYRALHPREIGNQGQAILSRFPISEDTFWRNPQYPFSLGHQRVQLDLNFTSVVIYNTHPIHPGMTGRFFDPAARRTEIDILLEKAAQETVPVLIGGDFNMTDQTADYFHIVTHYGDTFREIGRGMGLTFPDLSHPQALPSFISSTLPIPPLLRLDYVFHSPHFQAVEARVWPTSGGSDHRPLYVRVALTPAG